LLLADEIFWLAPKPNFSAKEGGCPLGWDTLLWVLGLGAPKLRFGSVTEGVEGMVEMSGFTFPEQKISGANWVCFVLHRAQSAVYVQAWCLLCMRLKRIFLAVIQVCFIWFGCLFVFAGCGAGSGMSVASPSYML
jgi:hypothetical protein